MGARGHASSGRLYRGCPWLRPGPQGARAAPPPASCLELLRRRGAALRQAAAALPHTWCACRAACRLRVPVEHAADRRLRGRKVIGLPARARHDERRATPWPVRSCECHLKKRSASLMFSRARNSSVSARIPCGSGLVMYLAMYDKNTASSTR